MNYNGGLTAVTVSTAPDGVESYVDGQTIASKHA